MALSLFSLQNLLERESTYGLSPDFIIGVGWSPDFIIGVGLPRGRALPLANDGSYSTVWPALSLASPRSSTVVLSSISPGFFPVIFYSIASLLLSTSFSSVNHHLDFSSFLSSSFSVLKVQDLMSDVLWLICEIEIETCLSFHGLKR